jgi:hypothetical protein
MVAKPTFDLIKTILVAQERRSPKEITLAAGQHSAGG